MKRDTTRRPLPMLGALLAAIVWPGLTEAETVDFEDVGAGLAAEEYWNGSDGFTSGSLGFHNSDTGWGSWSYSNMTDTTTPGYTNQYSAFTGAGAGGSATYGLANNFETGDVRITIPAGYYVASAMITNTTYAALSMTSGDSFAKKFGGASGDDADWFLLTIRGIRDGDNEIGSEEIYLADYRDINNDNDYILSDWAPMDLSSLIGARKLEFSLTSTDVGQWGMNTPAYFAMDNIVLEQVPEPSTIVLLLSAAAALLLVRRRRR